MSCAYMAASSAACSAVRTVATPLSFRGTSSCRGCMPFERRRELVARRQAQLAEDAREVALDGARGHEQRLRDLAVGEALARELGDAPLARGQRLEAGQRHPARACARRPQLCLGLCRKRACAGSMRSVQGGTEELTRLAAAVSTPELRAEVGQSSRAVDTRAGAGEGRDCFAKQRLPIVAPRD